MASSRRPLLLMDANVLIDFCDSERTVIPLISKHIGRVHVPMPILLEEVEQFQDFDWIARENGWTCVTNDGRLRRECTVEDVAILWGLEVVALLVEDDVLAVAVAEGVGRAIRAANPRFITAQILDRFLKRIGAGRPRSKR